jgi:hypothetical protein
VFVADFPRDMAQVEEILQRDFSNIYRKPQDTARAARPILSAQRSLGSVIKLLTPSSDYTDEHNDWIGRLPASIRQLIVTVKRYYRPEWGDDWRRYFSVDRINGALGHELKYRDTKLVGNYLRVGYDREGSWRIFKLRPDFHAADKVQVEDDITASVVLPTESLGHLDPEYTNPSVKLVANCEERLFQRPDDAIHRGFDKDAEADIARPGTFLSNFEPLDLAAARALVDNVVEFDRYTDPMRTLIADFASNPDTGFIVSSAHPRVVDGAPSKNPRYLQQRPDLADPRSAHLAEIGTRMAREVPSDAVAHFPVNAVLAGRRNNPPDRKAGIPPLAVYSPIHYQELPELFMDFICSLTGKSPSTTGFGSEGALTKGPFNALWPVVDLNNALVSAVVTGYAGFTTAAGHVGPHYRMDHDNSMLVPEVWCRMRVHEREPSFLIANGYLERVEDFSHHGRVVRASRLGYRITPSFVDRFLGRIFEMPGAVFTEELLRPEKQGLDVFAEGVDAICEAQRLVALHYFEDGSVEAACPPIRALLHIMAHGHFGGKPVDDPSVRRLFERDVVMQSDWYLERLRVKQQRDIRLWTRHVEAAGERARAGLARVTSPGYLTSLAGTIGADPFALQSDAS